ncbi:U-box domain-containing protein 7-like [Bidens hawaiensis]|uniref:U-box domain-containing protein 7-like n=1 Tax=Bidens hawaiensis TaxID=980011 RepID=UPI00404ACA62
MGTDVTEAVEKLPSICDIKVHSIMCIELIKLVDRVDKIIPEIESAKPRCSSGIESLCLLICGIDKAKLLIRDCCQSSKLYMALTGNTVLSRCKRSKNLLEQSLSRIQNMVPVMLASKISKIMGKLRVVEFSLNPSEEEAGKAIRSLLDGYRTGNHLEKEYENERIQIAAQKLKITSSKALLIEQRSIKKLIAQLDEGTNKQQKKQILSFLLHLLNKYGKSIASNKVENHDYKSQTVDFRVDREKDMLGTPPEELKCFIPQKLECGPDVIHSNPFIQFYNDVNTWEESSSSVNSLSSMRSLQLPDDCS